MKKQLIYIMLLFLFIITVIPISYSIVRTKASQADFYQEQLVDLNEIVQLSELDEEDSDKRLKEAVNHFKEKLAGEQDREKDKDNMKVLWILYGLNVLFVLLVFCYVYRVILRPFHKLQTYADEVAKGNFDLDLKYERTNYFGKFTWAFDHMRREITKARACEKEAIDNNKTVIATLSHDIKTPIASIRAYAEGLDANLDSGPEMRRKYSSVIMKKCDEVTRLTNDLFLHSLSDLDKLKMLPVEEDFKDILTKLLAELQLKDDSIILPSEIPDAKVMIDIKRFEQVFENLINNAKKYAPGSRIMISCEVSENDLLINVQDYGSGIPDEDMPFIFDKFYRGRNVLGKQGSGLGLYIVKYIMEQMSGSVSLHNTSPGLKVILTLPISEKK